MSKFAIIGVGRLLLILAWMCMPGLPAMATDATDHLNVQEPKRPSYIPLEPTEIFQLPRVEDNSPVFHDDGEPGFFIDRIIIRGNRAISTSELELISAPYSGRKVNASAIEELRQKLTRYYIDHGYVNSGALLASGKEVGGELVFDIVEGKLLAIRLHGMERLKDNYVIKRLTKGSQEALNTDILRERFQLLLDDPLIAGMNARLMPGTNPGEATLDVDVRREQPYGLTATVDNHRPPSVGSESLGLSGWVRDLTGYGDYLDASIRRPVHGDPGFRGGIGWQIPLNYSGTELSLRYERDNSTVVEEPTNVLDIKSTLTSYDFGLSQVLLESLKQKLSIGLNRVYRENRTWLLGQPFSFIPGEPNGDTKVRSTRFWQEYTYRNEKQVLALRSTFSSASDNLRDIAGLPNVTQPEQQYFYWLGQVQYARQVMENGAQVILHGTYQTTGDVMLALDRMSIGGAYTVRGYRENQLLRDKGYIFNAEFDYPLLANSSHGLALNLRPFFDLGRGKNIGEEASTISSCGIATKLRWRKLTIDLSLAKRLAHPDSLKRENNTLQDRGLEFQVSYSL